MLLALTTGQKLAIAGVAAVFIVFALAASFLAPRRNRDFPGSRGLPWFVAASLLLFVAMLAAIVVFAREDEEEVEHAAAETPAGEVEGNPDAGREVFASAGCGSCHALEAAGATATVGPDLDELRPGFEATVEQVTNGGGGMPAFGDSLSEEQIRDVAAYVVESTG